MAEDTNEVIDFSALKEETKQEPEECQDLVKQALTLAVVGSDDALPSCSSPDQPGITLLSVSGAQPPEENENAASLQCSLPDPEVLSNAPLVIAPKVKSEDPSEEDVDGVKTEAKVESCTKEEETSQESISKPADNKEDDAADSDATVVDEPAAGGEEWTPRRRGRQPSSDFMVYITAVLPEASSCKNAGQALNEYGLGVPSAEMKGGARVRSKLSLSWAEGDLAAYIREQFPIIKEYELMRAGPSGSLVCLPPTVNTPSLIRENIGRSGLYVRPKGTMADIGLIDPVTIERSPRRKPVTPPSEQRKRGRQSAGVFHVNIVAITEDITSVNSIDYDTLKDQGLGIPESELQGTVQQKSQLLLKWTARELETFLRSKFPKLKKYELLRATGKQLQVIPAGKNTPRTLKRYLGRSELYVRALQSTPKVKQTVKSQSPTEKLLATKDNVDKLKNILRQNFQSVLGSTIEYSEHLSIKAVIDLVVDKQDPLNFCVTHSWDSELMLGGREGPESPPETKPVIDTKDPDLPGYSEAEESFGKMDTTGDTTEEENDMDIGPDGDGDNDSDTTAVVEKDSDDEDGIKEGQLTAAAEEYRAIKEDPEFLPKPGKRGRGRPRKDGLPPRQRTERAPRGARTKVPSERKVYKRKQQWDESNEEAWDAARVEAYLNSSLRKLTCQRLDKYGDLFRNALKAVKTRDLTVRAAASKFNLPYGVLWEEVNHTRFQCWYCKKNFASGCQLRRHITSHLDVYDHKCELCPKTFKCIENLRRHLKVHQSTRPYVCERCGQSFITKESFTRHELKHDNVRNYVCVICSRQFLTKGELQGHARVHTGRKDFVCSTCGTQFSRRTSLNKHITYVHSTVCKHMCTKCGKGFKMKYGLDRHMLLHTGESRYNCEVCGKGFKWHASRKLHMKKHQLDKVPGRYNQPVRVPQFSQVQQVALDQHHSHDQMSSPPQIGAPSHTHSHHAEPGLVRGEDLVLAGPTVVIEQSAPESLVVARQGEQGSKMEQFAQAVAIFGSPSIFPQNLQVQTSPVADSDTYTQ